MARTRIALYTEPHVAEVGPHELLFEPEVLGVDFAQAYADLRTRQEALPADPEQLAGDVEAVRAASDALRAFLAGFMLEESRPVFADLALPERVLGDLFRFVIGVYGGGEERPTGSSSESSTSSSQSGPRSTATSRSKASTLRRGRSAA